MRYDIGVVIAAKETSGEEVSKMLLLFVGDKPSTTALARNWTWRDGRLAAKPLFRVLREVGINPDNVDFLNWFEDELQREMVIDYARRGWKIIALGSKVSRALTANRIVHCKAVHPAARGKIRKKWRYSRHIKKVLRNMGVIA